MGGADTAEEALHPETMEADAEIDDYDLPQNDLTQEEETARQQIFLPVVVQP